MRVAVVILNWNGKALLEEFLPYVLRFSPSGTRIFVADNASTDESVAFVEGHFPEVNIIRHRENLGYAGGYNEALKDIKADLYCLLNSDVEVTPGWLEPVIEHFQTHPGTVLAQPKILDYHRRTYFEYAGASGGFVDTLAYPYCRGRMFGTLEEDRGQYDDAVPVFWASGACLFARASAFERLGGFDTTYVAHQEEIDLCWRAYNTGSRVYVLPRSKVYHVGGASLPADNPRKTFYNFRNSLFNLLKNAPCPSPKILLRLVLDGVAGVVFLLRGKPRHTVAVVRAHFSFYRHLPEMLNKRRKFPRKRGYAGIRSLLWKYYIAGKRHFQSLG